MNSCEVVQKGTVTWRSVKDDFTAQMQCCPLLGRSQGGRVEVSNVALPLGFALATLASKLRFRDKSRVKWRL